MTAKVLTFGSLKGGAGKTKVSTNVAAALAVKGHKVLMIDMDPQSSATEDFGISVDVDAGEKSLADILNLNTSRISDLPSLEHIIRPAPNVDNLHVLPASYQELEAAGKSLTGARGDFALLNRVIKPAGAAYDYIVIDTPPRLGELTRAAVYAADYAIPVTGPTAATFTGAISFAAQVEECIEDSPKPITIPFWVVANWEEGAEARSVRQEMEGAEDITTLPTFLPKSKLASAAALDYQTPVVVAGPNQPFSLKVKSLVEEMVAAGI